ncbi:hypothetical protein A5696_02360 [Mycobacterium sp. E2699]|uniref:nSTAND1 domain-containing NTPase n=1 Tax=Mycobacterium sp. E2699 TaxID=1834137 RepID=UPI0007FD0B78|nr:TIR domain-containing protein [Mycobacterium sp. E2699]OBH07196.1 hypothetical protein A5696_02360 [Mycobacterium sp. E2699]
MSRVFVSHSAEDRRAAIALRNWLCEHRPQLVNEIFLDLGPDSVTGSAARWKRELFKNDSRCEAVICLVSAAWQASAQCRAEYRTSEGLGKQILVARLEDTGPSDITSEWQRCDLFAVGPQTPIEVPGGPPLRFNSAALDQLRRAIAGTGVGPENFVWPPAEDPLRAPYRGWEPFETLDAGVFFGRDAAIVRGLDEMRAMRLAGAKPLFVVLGPSGSGKSSFLRAGLIPRLQREDGRFAVLGIMRPERAALTGEHGFAAAIHSACQRLGLRGTRLGDIKRACLGDPDRIARLLTEARSAAAKRLADVGRDGAAPTLVLPLDQAEELFSVDAGDQAEQFLTLLAASLREINAAGLGFVVAATIRTDSYEAMQNHRALDGLGSVLFNELRPMPASEFRDVIVGPAARTAEAEQHVRFSPALVQRLIEDAREGADTLPLLSLTLARLYTDWLDADVNELTVDDYEAMGGMRDVVNNEIDEILADSPHDRRTALAILRSAFIPWLATINPDSDQPVRRVARYRDLPEDSHPLIDALVRKRLMVRDERDGEVVIEVALESLLRQWNSLAGWLREERQHLLTADDVERGAAAWAGHDRNPSWLLTGTRLVDAESLAATAEFKERLLVAGEYLRASRVAEDASRMAEARRREAELRDARERQQTAEAHAAALRRRSRVLRAVVAGTAVVAVIAVVGAILAATASVHARSARRQAQSRFLDATAVRLRAEAGDIFTRSAPGGDVRAFQELLAADTLANTHDDRPLLHAAAVRSSTLKVADTGARVLAVSVSPDGHRLATGGDDNNVRLWSADTGQPLMAPLTGHTGMVTGVAFSPDGRRLATSSRDHTVRLWDTASGKPIGNPLTGHTGWVTSVAFGPDGHRLASGADDMTVRLWDADTGRPVGSPLTGHTDVVTGVAFSPDGQRVASGSRDKTVRQWDVATGRAVGAPLAGHTNQVRSVAYSPDGHRLASGGDDNSVRLWDADTGRQLGPPWETHTDGVTGVAFSPDGRRLASCSVDNTVRLWDAETGRQLGSPLTGHTNVVLSVAFSPDGRRLASAGWDHTFRLWDATEPLAGNNGMVDSVAFSPDGRLLATGGEDHTARLWNVSTREPAGPPLTGHTSTVLGVAFSPDGHRLATAGDDDTVVVFDVGTGRPVGTPISAHSDGVSSVAFSPDGRRLVTGGGDGTVRLWEAATGRPSGAPLTGSARTVWSVAFSPDGHRVAAGGLDYTVRLWNADTGEAIGTPLEDRSGKVYGVAFSPDGHRLASVSEDHLVRLWNADTGHLVGAPMSGHTDVVLGVAFSPDGHRLASGGRDATVRLWDADTQQPLFGPLTGHANSVTAVAFSPDGQRLASGSGDGTARLWPVTATSKTLCDKLIANMSHKQWRDWVSPDIPYVATCPGLPTPADEPAG